MSRNRDWDINDAAFTKLKNSSLVYDSWEELPDGHVRYVYSPNSEEAKKHTSGWAMRNTNNHNVNILKKSCLGVLVCSKRCIQRNGKPVSIRPAICDKARKKQQGKVCPTLMCDGFLEIQPCRGHCGYPVTHFWRYVDSIPGILFQAKGRHDHSKPASKSFSNSLKRKGTQKQQHQDRSQKQIRMTSEVSSCMSPIKASYNQIHEYSSQITTKDVFIPDCNFQNRSLQSSWADERLLSSNPSYCANPMEDYEGRSANPSIICQQSPNVYHSFQDNSPLNSRQAEEINSNHLLMSPATLPFSENEHHIYRVDKVSSDERHDRHSKGCSQPNNIATFSSTANSHNHYIGENYYESPSMAMIESINNSHSYSTHHTHHLPHPTHEHATYDDNQGERNTFQHNIYNATSNDSYNPTHPFHASSVPPSSDISSFAEDSLSSSAVAVYHFNNTLIDFTNPGDIFQFDRVHSTSNEAEEPNNSSMCPYPQQHQPSPSSNQGYAILPEASQSEYTNNGNSEEMISAESNSISLRDYSQDHSQIRMIHQSQGFESIGGGISEAMGNYNSSLTSCSNNEITESSDHCLLPNFPSYFASREDKCSRHLNHKQNKVQHTTESRYSQSEHKSPQLPNYRHNV